MATLTFETVRKLGLSLPGVTDGTAYGAPALKFDRKILACVPTNKSAEPDCIVVRIDFDHRARLLEQHPETYYITGHYERYPSVLVRLSAITQAGLSELLTQACAAVSAPRASQAVKSRHSKGM
ncbi:hypothetical protein SAMN05443245_5703 [Paraburkholderia fungorum]|uniref:MmcQ/YjbR family DNA-binding protein n=1 Tax=Paraburkholderia fungorum TaxID=134537 RepID=A0A1H1IUH7_9BURK|nr:MmcQ/YjbR family DNA-binding protein [Paraburkholderia fungorum]SDR41375.1 hypothetical protein SAMN05443245_5703 [Paraburkholderia fungorum]